MNWLRTLTNQFKDTPTTKSINKFKISQGKLIPNYTFKEKVSQTQFKSFMSLDYGDFTSPQKLEQEQNPDEEPPKRSADEEEALQRRIKEIRQNNTLFEDQASDSEISETQDILLTERKKSKDFMDYQLKDFMYKSMSFEKLPSPKIKSKVSPGYRFRETYTKNNGDQWRNDLEWRNTVNPLYDAQNKSVWKKEFKMVEKRHEAHKLKALALGQDLKAFDKKVIRELKKKIF